MHRSTFARAGAIFTASALALSLSAGPSSADDTQTANAAAIPGYTTAGTSDTTWGAASSKPFQATAAGPNTDIISFGQKSGVLYKKAAHYFPGTPRIVLGTKSVTSIVTRLTSAGHNRGNITMYQNGISVPYNAAAGKAKLGPSVIRYSGGTTSADPTIGGYFYIRRATKSNSSKALSVTRHGKSIKFKANSWKVFKPATGTYVGMNTIKLQYRSGSHWKTKKTIKLNVYGTGSYSTKTSTKRKYRLYYGTTDTTIGARTAATRKI